MFHFFDIVCNESVGEFLLGLVDSMVNLFYLCECTHNFEINSLTTLQLFRDLLDHNLSNLSIIY